MKRYAAVLVTVMLLLAGCSGGTGSTGTTTTTQLSGTTDAGATTAQTESGTSSASQGTVEFYVSDEKNAMGDFEHLNVTVSKVGLKSGNESNSSWQNYEVDNRTIDLTELTGPNATHVGSFDANATTYQAVFVYVEDVNGTLKNGEQVNVKLPSSKLQIKQQFTVGANESTDFVFDISVFEAGKSGKYILKPVISESGTDVEIDPVDEKGGAEDGNESSESALNASFVGNVTQGENVTVEVTENGSAVANATVRVDGAVVGETNADGTLTISVPDVTVLEVEVETDDASATLKHEFEASGQGNSENGSGGNGN
ncbi:DUF4382 domain-containing protein [Halorussus halophilus]|uniref:DUF4382 domain-containing protein n=1 Tax=Halorussus halophilus TaxID=2650975 RepID=UPI0013019B11|nr:DUF4382 domain-containing protein [Halorussus halophilus]